MTHKFFNYVKRHLFVILGFLFMYIAPVVLLVEEAIRFKIDTWKIDLWALPIVAFIVLSYWIKFRKWIKEKKRDEKLAKRLGAMEQPLSLLFFTFLDKVLAPCATLGVIYYALATISKMGAKAENYILCILAFVGTGGVLYLVDAIVNISKNHEGKNE